MRPRSYSIIKGVAKIGQVFLIHNKMFKKSPFPAFGDANVGRKNYNSATYNSFFLFYLGVRI
jgi:hypothetical protein